MIKTNGRKTPKPNGRLNVAGRLCLLFLFMITTATGSLVHKKSDLVDLIVHHTPEIQHTHHEDEASDHFFLAGAEKGENLSIGTDSHSHPASPHDQLHDVWVFTELNPSLKKDIPFVLFNTRADFPRQELLDGIKRPPRIFLNS